MRKTLLSTLAIALLLGGSSVCAAAGSGTPGLKPVFTVSFAGYDELRADLDFLGKLGDAPDMAQQLEGMLKLMTQNKGLVGLDTKRPWGAVVQTDGSQFPVFGFIPVSDLKGLMGVIREMQMAPVPEDPADGVYEISLGDQSVFVQQKGDWAVIAATREGLGQAPADPTALLGGLNEKYVLAVRASIQNVPTDLREMFIAQMEEGAAIGMQQLPDETDETYALRAGTATKIIEMVKSAVNELDEVLLGWAIDREAATSYLDVQVTAVSGTDTAAVFARGAAAKTRFAGFDLPGAVATIAGCGVLSDDDVKQLKSGLSGMRAATMKELDAQGLSEDEKALASRMVSDVFEVVEKTLEGKKLDTGMALVLKPDAATMVYGTNIAAGDKLEQTLKLIVAEAIKAEPEGAKYLKLDAGLLGDVRLHVLSIPTAEVGDENITKLCGETLDVVLGINDTTLYLAAGRDAQATLKQAIDASKAQADKEIPLSRIVVAGAPIAKFAAEMGEDDQVKQLAGMIAAMLGESAGKDRLIVTLTLIPNGVKARLEIEQGLLKLIGAASQMAGMGSPTGTDAPVPEPIE